MSSPPPPAPNPTLLEQVQAVLSTVAGGIQAGLTGTSQAVLGGLGNVVQSLLVAAGFVGSTLGRLFQDLLTIVADFITHQLSTFAATAGRLAMAIDLVAKEVDDLATFSIAWLQQQITELRAVVVTLRQHIFDWVADSVVGETERWLVDLPGRLYHAKPPGALPAPDEFSPHDTLTELSAALEAQEAGLAHWVEEVFGELMEQVGQDFPAQAGGAGEPPLPPVLH